jgi:RND superfamily putative drug exporter
MIAVFTGFILSRESLIMMMGFALAVAVLIDAFVVCMTIVPAVLTLLGRRAWLLPNGWTECSPASTPRGKIFNTR